jgi:hypothetical protein
MRGDKTSPGVAPLRHRGAKLVFSLDPGIEQVSKPYEPDVLAAILRRTLSS